MDQMKQYDRNREALRLAALESYDILDTPREKEFDDIAALAAKICGTPIGVLNFITSERQFFKAEVGLGLRETSLASSFCAKAILEEDFLLVPDATIDARFQCNPLVTGDPYIRFYAGALLKSENGYPIGTLCVLGYQPRTLSEEQQFALRVLADQAISQLALRRRIADLSYDLTVERRLASKRQVRVASTDAKLEQLKQDGQRNAAAQAAGGVGIFEVDTKSNTMTVSSEFCRIYGVAEARSYPACVFEDLILVEDRHHASTSESRNSASAVLDVEYRIRRASDQRIRWIARRAQFLEDDHGRPLKMVGVAIDVTDAKRKDARVAALLALGDRLSLAGSLHDIARIASEILSEGLGVDRAGYASMDPGGLSIQIEYEHVRSGMTRQVERHDSADYAQTIARLGEGRLVAVANTHGEAFLQDEAAIYRDLNIGSFIKVPLIKENRLVGVLFAHDERPHFWGKAELDFAAGVADRTYAAIAKFHAEAEQRILNHELSHRIKNSLAIVHALIGQTLKGVTQRDAVEALSGRIQALGSAHELLLQQSWSSAQLRQVIEQAMYLHADSRRVFLNGPATTLGPKAGLSIALLLHELGTNALKYGALSNDLGEVHISWCLKDPDKSDPHLELIWEERLGPPITQPDKTGFGSRLIRMGLGGNGQAELDYRSTGLLATFRAPLSIIMHQPTQA
ncbi:GAF domain-containing protein [Brucella pseudogrignonensis]|uniref:GAF domain-containing protein n=1 Tax=Brucella pseudogrignonensis TaxID=419475 RepID=UPI001E478A1A|nr:GAF domain-containing protein [Brucella pseudogrignonensis]MCD4511830.1 GAF domain-containing protein [Brucella pseudogrignonensis]